MVVDEHDWRVDGEWDERFPDELDDWCWVAETQRLKGIPDRVAEVNVERGFTQEILLAWDISDAIRIHDFYQKDISLLMDLPVDIPVGLAHWIADPLSRRSIHGNWKLIKVTRGGRSY